MFKHSFMIGGNAGHFGSLRSAKDLRESIMHGEWLCSSEQAVGCLEMHRDIGYHSDELMLVEIEAEDQEIGILLSLLQRGDVFSDFDFRVVNWARVK